MPKFPVEAPLAGVITTLETLSLRVVRRGNHIAMIRDNEDGTKTPLTMPNHRTITSSTPRTILSRSGIQRDDFLNAYSEKWERDRARLMRAIGNRHHHPRATRWTKQPAAFFSVATIGGISGVFARSPRPG